MAELFFEEIVRRLTTHQVEFVVVGGLSAVLHGAPLVTLDIDLCFRRSPDNIRRIVAALAPMNPRLRDFPEDLPFFFDERTLELGTNFTLLINSEPVDLLTEMSAIGGYEQIVGDAETMQVGTALVKVLTLDKLIQSKRAAGRPKDLSAIPTLEATLEVKRQSR
jgi:hypothetical protein